MRTPEVSSLHLKHMKGLHASLVVSESIHNVSNVECRHVVGGVRSLSFLLETIEKGKTQDLLMLEWSLLLRYVNQWSEQAFAFVVAECAINQAISRKVFALFLKKGVEQKSYFCCHIAIHKRKLTKVSEQWEVAINLWGTEKKHASNAIEKLSVTNKTFGENQLSSKHAWLWKRVGKQRLVDTLLQHHAFTKRGMPQENRDYMVRWFSRCLDEVYKQDSIYAISIVKTLADSLVSKSVRHIEGQLQALAPWLGQHVSISAAKGVWQSLSPLQRDVFSMIMGEKTYAEFNKLIVQLAKSKDEKEGNQLRKRVEFWKGYKQYFLDFSVFASGSSYDFLLEQELPVKKLEARDKVAVCVMETERWIIVEVLSGWGAEMLVFPYSFRHYFERDTLELQEIKKLKPEFTHDHCSYWQWSLFTMLEGINLKGTSRLYGLPLKDKQLEDREKALEAWRRKSGVSALDFKKLSENLHTLKNKPVLRTK